MKKPDKLAVVYWPISKLKPYVRNPRKNDHAVDRMCESIKQFGFTIPVLVRKSGEVIDGHLRLKAAIKLELSEVPVILCDSWTEAQVKAFRLLVNRSVTWADWDADALAAEFLELKAMEFDLTLTGFDLDEITTFDPAKPFDETAETMPDPPANPITQSGDLWILGAHRLLCADSTLASSVERLARGEIAEAAITDPPYNVGFDYGNFNDSKSDEAYAEWNRKWFNAFRAAVRSCVVLTTGITNLPMWIAEIERTHRIIAWIKSNQCSRNYIGATSGFNVWEPVLVYGRAKKCVSRDSFDIPIHIQPDTGDHPCPKSIKAWRWLLDSFTDTGDVVLDPFLGSGTTLIASELDGRICYGVELSPAYCDVIVTRWQNLTGKTATLEAR